MPLIVNDFEYKFLKESKVLQQLAKEQGTTISAMIKRHCEVGDDTDEILLQSDIQETEKQG